MNEGRSVAQILGVDAGRALGESTLPGVAGTQPGSAAGQVGAVPLGSHTGAPPQTQLRTYQVIPASAVGVSGQQATLVVDGARASRVIVFTAPLTGFSIFVGDAGVGSNPGSRGMSLPPGLPYEVILPGGQELYAVTDAPIFLPLKVQIASLLIGDRERPYR